MLKGRAKIGEKDETGPWPFCVRRGRPLSPELQESLK